MCFGPFKRICNWGPLTALAIIKIITLMTIHCSKQWWGLNGNASSDISFIIFIFFSGLTLYHFINSIYEGPGYLPYNWVPENESDCEFLQFCVVCCGFKAPRSHHCRKCSRCVMKMDHHCPWINNCVGHFNHGYFTAFLASAVAGCCISTYIMVNWLMTVFSSRPLPFPPPSVLIVVSVLVSTGLSIGVVVAVGMLLFCQLHAIVKNQTGIESWILAKAKYRRSALSEQFIHPYSKNWFFNIKQVISWDCAAPGDGIVWPVIEGCDQYTLTREQIAQKKEKRKRAKSYRIIKKVSGSWVPISHGLKVLCSPPITDEPRIKLDVGDTVTVTRWRKYWLFGEKEVPLEMVSAENRVRGWFPRPCAILCELDDYFEMEQDTQTVMSSVQSSTKLTEAEGNYNHCVQKVSSNVSNKKKHK